MPTVLRQEFKTWQFSNKTGGAILLNALVLVGGVGFVLAKTAAAANAGFAGVVEGIIAIDKQAGDVFVQGDTVYWDSANSRASLNPPAGGGVALGVVSADAGNGLTEVSVMLGAKPQEFSINQDGNASGGGFAINTGFGKIPTGGYTIQVLQNTGAPRTISSLVWAAGTLTVVTSAGAANDRIIGIFKR
jgi:predicted RecA/RadA family phage recombinase